MTSLTTTLRLNGVICALFAGLFLAAPRSVSAYLGDPPALAIAAIGAGLLVNAIHLLLVARRHATQCEILWFSLGDMAWWLISIGLVAAEIWVTNLTGAVTAVVVAALVAVLGLAQLWLGAMGSSATSERLRAIGRSWLAIEGWVKVWLLVLNFIFLVALAFPAFRGPVLLSYAASGPLLAAAIIRQGGITRATGVGHLIPWLPLAVWLGFTLFRADLTLVDRIYGTALLTSLFICLAFDLYDLVRWARGERAVFGAR